MRDGQDRRDGQVGRNGQGILGWRKPLALGRRSWKRPTLSCSNGPTCNATSMLSAIRSTDRLVTRKIERDARITRRKIRQTRRQMVDGEGRKRMNPQMPRGESASMRSRLPRCRWREEYPGSDRDRLLPHGSMPSALWCGCQRHTKSKLQSRDELRDSLRVTGRYRPPPAKLPRSMTRWKIPISCGGLAILQNWVHE